MAQTKDFWYGADESARGRRILNALRTFQAADGAMRRRTRAAMAMGENELTALRLIIRSAREGHPATPREVSTYLGVSSASVSALLDRLSAAGHVECHPHPTDRRSITVTPTPAAEEAVRHTLGDMHERMLSATQGFTEDQAAAIVEFLEGLTSAVDQISAPEPAAAGAVAVVRASA